MMLQTLTIRLPEQVYQNIEQRARRTQRSIEDELAVVVATALPTLDELPVELADELAQLNLLTDNELRGAAESVLPPEDSEQMQALAFKRQREGLTVGEQQTAEHLLRRSERLMLIRAKAAILLKERDQDISTLG